MKGLSYGNINEHSFIELWEGEQRRKVIKKINNFGISICSTLGCRLDDMNKYLHQLKFPGLRVNFI